uniref:Uncharacterized protein n=3 Tax=Oryza TaxID=4527 RepID=Q2QZ70_ORYSJ|nr:hypothetical protein [Oryza sativa Japonica Group]ABA95471.1 hypothetical protein LOC_Os11g47480 [Oryza sativa Japonica Group]
MVIVTVSVVLAATAVGGDDVVWMLKLSRTLELLGPEETSETILAFSNFSKDGCHNKDIFCVKAVSLPQFHFPFIVVHIAKGPTLISSYHFIGLIIKYVEIILGDPGDGSNRDVSADKTKTNLHDLVSTNLKL